MKTLRVQWTELKSERTNLLQNLSGQEAQIGNRPKKKAHLKLSYDKPAQDIHVNSMPKRPQDYDPNWRTFSERDISST